MSRASSDPEKLTVVEAEEANGLRLAGVHREGLRHHAFFITYEGGSLRTPVIVVESDTIWRRDVENSSAVRVGGQVGLDEPTAEKYHGLQNKPNFGSRSEQINH